MTKGTIAAEMSVSLDGYYVGPEDSPEYPLGKGGHVLHQWIFEGGRFDEIIEQARTVTGAMVMGRWSYEVARGWGDEPPFQMPIFVVTHRHREPVAKAGGTTFHFVTEGFDRALDLALDAAEGKQVALHGGQAIDHALRTGRLSELTLHVVPVLLGGGKRLFEGAVADPAVLELREVERTGGVVHLRYALPGGE